MFIQWTLNIPQLCSAFEQKNTPCSLRREMSSGCILCLKKRYDKLIQCYLLQQEMYSHADENHLLETEINLTHCFMWM